MCLLPFLWENFVLSPSFSILNCSAEEEHARAGRRVQVLNNLILGVGLTIFFVLDHACIKSMTCKAIILCPAMSRNVTYWQSINAGNLEIHLGIIRSSYILNVAMPWNLSVFFVVWTSRCCVHVYIYIYIYMLACSCVYQWVCLHTANTLAFFTWLHRWKGGWGIRLEGSDHAPVYTSLEEIHDIPTHSTLPLSARYHLPMIHGVQQTLGMTIVF